MPGVTSWRVVRQCTLDQLAFKAEGFAPRVMLVPLNIHANVWLCPCGCRGGGDILVSIRYYQSCEFESFWTLSRKSANKLTHALMGNGGGNKSKGKGRGNPHLDPQLEYARAMNKTLPEAAQIRAQPKLLQEHWIQTVKEWQHLGSSGGVAIAPKESSPKTLEKVGYSSKPVGILVVQGLDEIGTKVYPSSRVVQVGFAKPASMKATGDEVSVGFTLVRMVAKLSTLHGWSHGPHPGGHLKQFVDQHAAAFDSVLPRGDVLVLVYHVHEEQVLSKNGQQEILKLVMPCCGLVWMMLCGLLKVPRPLGWLRKAQMDVWPCIFVVKKSLRNLPTPTSTTTTLPFRGARCLAFLSKVSKERIQPFSQILGTAKRDSALLPKRKLCASSSESGLRAKAQHYFLQELAATVMHALHGNHGDEELPDMQLSLCNVAGLLLCVQIFCRDERWSLTV